MSEHTPDPAVREILGDHLDPDWVNPHHYDGADTIIGLLEAEGYRIVLRGEAQPEEPKGCPDSSLTAWGEHLLAEEPTEGEKHG